VVVTVMRAIPANLALRYAGLAMQRNTGRIS